MLEGECVKCICTLYASYEYTHSTADRKRYLDKPKVSGIADSYFN